MWLFHLRCNSFTSTVWWEYGLFLQLFAGGLHAWVRLLVIPLEFQKTRHQPFPYNTAFLYGSVIVCGCFISTVRWKYSLFLRFSPWRDPRLRHFSGYPFGVSRKKTSTIFITQPSILSFMRPFVPVRRRSATLQSQFLSTSGMCMAPCRTARQPVPDKSFFALSQSHSG